MTLLSLVNDAQDILSIPRSGIVATSTDQNVRTLLGLANQEGRELAKRHAWEELVTEKTFTATASAIQTGAVPTDMDRFLIGTFFNRTNHRRVTGPLLPEEWQAQQALTSSVLFDSFRFRGGDILITPTPAGTETYAFEYVSKNWCQSSGDTGQASWAADSDTGVLDEKLMLLGIIWRFRKARGFDYAEEFATYEKEVLQAIMRDGSRRTINYSFDDTLYDTKRPPYVTDGNWNLT